MAVNYSTYSASRAQALGRLGDSRRRQLEAEADAEIAEAQRKARESSDMENLLNLGIQAGAAYMTGGASLAYGGMMNQALMGDKQGWSRDISNLGQAAYGMGQANMAQSLADADQQFARKQASDERMYNMAMQMNDYEGAAQIAQGMNSAVSQYDKDRKNFKSQGFLPHIFQAQGLERSAVPSNIEMRPMPKPEPTEQLEATQQPMAGPEISYSSPIQNMENDMLTDYSRQMERRYG